jgi:UDP-N-acetylglucosamine acyltransferase
MQTAMRSQDSNYIHPDAELEEGVEIGRFTTIGPKVRVGKGTKIGSNVVVMGNTRLGERNRVFPGAVIGGEPQSREYKGEDTRVEVGDDNTIRECVTIHIGTVGGGGVTKIGSGNLIMTCAHAAHDCRLGNGTVISSGVLLGGHVKVEDDVTINGGSAVNQFVTVGRRAFIGGLTRIVHDVPPFMIVEGHRAVVRSVNVVGLKRDGFSEGSIDALKEAFRLIYRSELTRQEALSRLESRNNLTKEVRELVEFLRRAEAGRRGRAQEGD